MTSRRGHQTPNWPRAIVGLLAHIMPSHVSATRFRQAVVVSRATVRRCSDMEPLTQSGCRTSSHCDGRRRGGAKPAFLGPTPKPGQRNASPIVYAAAPATTGTAIRPVPMIAVSIGRQRRREHHAKSNARRVLGDIADKHAQQPQTVQVRSMCRQPGRPQSSQNWKEIIIPKRPWPPRCWRRSAYRSICRNAISVDLERRSKR